MSKIGIQTRGSGAVMRKYLRGGGLAKRGTGVALKTGGRAGKFGGGRTNLLEELGRVEAERSNPNRRAEISRVHGELNRGYNKGGRVGLKHGGKPWGTGPKPGTHEFLQHHLHKRKGKAVGGIAKGVGALVKKFKKKKVYPETEDLTHQKGPYVGDVGSEGKRRKAGPRGKGKSPGRKGGHPWRGAIPGRPRPGTPAPKYGQKPKKYQPAAEGGRIGLKKGGSDKNWIQKATASIKKRGTKGKCTPITKKGCTGRAKALAKTFKKMAAKRKA